MKKYYYSEDGQSFMPVSDQEQYQLARAGQPGTRATDILVLVGLFYWFFTNIITFAVRYFIPDWWDSPWVFFNIGTNILFAAIPFIMAICIKDKVIKIFGFVLAGLLAIYFLFSNIEWLLDYI